MYFIEQLTFFMIILEEPYISENLLQYVEATGMAVLNNNVAQKALDKYPALNIQSDEKLASIYHNGVDKNIYTISEYALDWVNNNLQDNELSRQISVSKDKTLFRKTCSSIYPDFNFLEISYDDLFSFDISSIELPIVLKPSVGFLSAGVYTVNNSQDWANAIADIKCNFLKTAELFPDSVVLDNRFILESYIKGKEFAIDLYFNGIEPVIVNIFEHPFVSDTDVKDRLYQSNKTIFDQYLPLFSEHLSLINQKLKLKNIPVHVEVRVEDGKVVPIEINPLRFAGLCLNELHQHIAGKHPLEYYLSKTTPDYEQMWRGKEDETYAFAVFERPENALNMKLDMEKLKQNFSEILEIRENHNPKLNIFAFVLFKTKSDSEQNNILNLNVEDLMMS